MPKIKSRKSSSKSYGLIVISVLIFVIFFSLLNQGPWSGTSIRHAAGTVGHTENPWILRKGDTVLDSALTLPKYVRLETGKLYTLSTRLSYDGSQDESPYAFMHLDHAYCRVLLDGQVLFSCMPEDMEKRDSAKSPGFIYKAFPLPHDCLGKELEIQLLPLLTVPIEYGLPEIEFGDFLSTLHAAILRDGPHDVVVVLCVLLGIATILFSAISLRGANGREGLSIGIFSLLFALYFITECRINAYYIGNPYYLYLVNYISFSLLPVSMMGFMRERLPEKDRKIFNSLIIAELLLVLVELYLHFSGTLDMREVVSGIHCVYFLDVLMVTILLLIMKDRRRKHALVLQLTPMILGMSVDVIVYWLHLNIGINDATFTILGVIIFLFIELFRVGRTSAVIYTESVRSNLYREMAYLDELTGVGNRRDYEKEIDGILNGSITYDSMTVASADLNYLKFVNDHFGHAAGDDLIRSAAQIMKDAVGDKGKVFRIGGDEFSLFLYNVDPDTYEDIARTMDTRIQELNDEREFRMSLAIGYVHIRNNDILEAVKDADHKMYADKALCKAQRP